MKNSTEKPTRSRWWGLLAWVTATVVLVVLWRYEANPDQAAMYMRMAIVVGAALPVLVACFAFLFWWLLGEDKPSASTHKPPV